MDAVQQQMYFGNLVLDKNRKRKMVFYGRVSTQHEEQLDALENQMQWYEDQTRYHSNWSLVNRYIDEGITGTLAKKRPAFMRMIEDARLRKFDLIVTREVCRFARNTVDTLVVTRELKNYGVEVFFVEDNIWTMDGDGELRLTIMATLAQEESRKISERVRAGQMVSRENNVLYGNGNIIGYDRDKINHTYVINEEQAETIRMVFNLYAQGMGEKMVVNELTRLGRLDGNGKVKWSCVKVSRILKNATYMGYICYNKSKVNNYLEKKRIKNLDEDSIVMVKGNFEPIVSEELWRLCEKKRKAHIAKYEMPDGETRRRGASAPQHLWVRKLRCRCGSGFSRFKWRTNMVTGLPVYGYQCIYRTTNPTKSFVETHQIKGQKSCDEISICEWKLEMMAKHIFSHIWGDQQQSVSRACQMIESCVAADKALIKNDRDDLSQKAEKIKKRIMNYGRMRADEELSKEQYKALCSQAEEELDSIKRQLATIVDTHAKADLPYDFGKIQKALARVIDVSGAKISDELIDEFVEVVTPVENYAYRWKLNLGETKSAAERTDLTSIDTAPILSFVIDFEAAQKYRQANNMPQQFRRAAWTDLRVEVYL